ncbi:MAG TPA: mechanosensitive ion channel family protein [Anaerolineae bacterium]|nr:mechanosensitive ion channel family protein [Anaerolineae bacterium]
MSFLDALTASDLWRQLLLIILFFFLAWIIYRLSWRLARRILSVSRFASSQRPLRPERKHTLLGLISAAITFIALATATILSLSLFVDTTTLIWVIGLFSAAFGLGARPVVSDFLSGASFIFEDTFDVGDKVRLPGLAGGDVEGIIEEVRLRTTVVRAPSGEPFTVPNGEIRVVRNFSRGRFSATDVKIRIEAADLGAAIPLLEELSKEAVTLLPNLLEPWQVISESGELGQQTELTLLAKARFGKAGEMRPRLLKLVQERLNAAKIDLAG